MILFHYPLDLSCPIQLARGNTQYDKLVKLEMKQLQINYMQEMMFRLNDYFFYQFIYALTDVNPYLDIIERLKVETDPFAEGASQPQHGKRRRRKSGAARGRDAKDAAKDEEVQDESSFARPSESESQSSSPGSSESSSDGW